MIKRQIWKIYRTVYARKEEEQFFQKMESTINQSVKGKGRSYSSEKEFCIFTSLMHAVVWTNQLDLCCPSSNSGTPSFSPCSWMSFLFLEFQRSLMFLSYIFQVVLFFLLDLTSHCDLLTKLAPAFSPHSVNQYSHNLTKTVF